VAYINRISKFLPNNPISNDEMEDYIGLVHGIRSKARAVVLRNNGIKSRYYAMDKSGKSTHTNAQLTAEAVRALCDDDFKLEEIDLMACGTTSPDQLVPSHASMVHGELGDRDREIASFTGSCCSGINALKYAYLAILSGDKKNAVATGSEKLSSWMKAERFDAEMDNLKLLDENPYLNFEKDFLRWMLSDGAGAILVQDKANESRNALRIDWIDMDSFGNELKTCMYSGASKLENGDLLGWNDVPSKDVANKTLFSLKQDVKILSENIVPYGNVFLRKIIEKRKLEIDQIDYFLPHLSSIFFKDKIYQTLKDDGNEIPYEKWFINLEKVGNVGSGSAFLMLEELFNSNKLEKGQRILLMIPESARFSYAYLHLTVV